jgi:hypothetical protein
LLFDAFHCRKRDGRLTHISLTPNNLHFPASTCKNSPFSASLYVVTFNRFIAVDWGSLGFGQGDKNVVQCGGVVPTNHRDIGNNEKKLIFALQKDGRMKKTITLLLIFLVGMSMLASVAIPHHHHHGNETACLAADCHRHEVCGNAETDARHAGGGDCCTAKYLSLSPPSLDSRKEHLCDCGHNGDSLAFHTYPFILADVPEVDSAPCRTIAAGADPSPAEFLSRPAVLFGGLRAPPAV